MQQKTYLSREIWPVTRNNIKAVKKMYQGKGWHYVCSVMADTPDAGGMVFTRRDADNRRESLRIKAEGGFGGQFAIYYEQDC